MAHLLLAIDVGTTGVRALLFDESSNERGGAYEELRTEYPQPGWVESDPSALWAATRKVIGAALDGAGARSADVAAVGVANQRATTLLWDRRTGEPLHRAIVWQDLRTAERVRELLDGGFFTNTMASATKIEWLLQNLPGAAARAARGEICFGTVDSWIVWNLTGKRVHVTDHSNASCTGLYDYFGGGWDDNALDVLQIPRPLLPEVRPSSGICGTCDPDASGLAAPVGAMSGDQQAAMFGQLRHRKGDVKITFGTSAMVDVNTGDQPVLPAAGAYPLVLWGIGDQRWFCIEGTVMTAGAAVQWLRDGLGIIRDASETSELAQRVPDAGGVWAVPAFQGLGTPHMKPDARAVLGGLSRGTTKAHVVRAVLEGIAFRCHEVVTTLRGAVDSEAPGVLRVDGGAAANDFLLQRLSDVLGVAVERPQTVQATALGAAYLAGMAAEVWSGLDDLREAWRQGARFEPRWDERERERRFAEWSERVAAAR